MNMKTSKKKLMTVILLMLLGIFALSPFSNFRAEPKVLSSGNFAIIFATGGLGDKSFNDAAYRGLVDAVTKYGSNITVDYVEPTTIPEFATYQRYLALEGTYDLIICVGFLQTAALTDTIAQYPDQKFVLIDDVIDHENISSITFKEHEGSFLVGAMAGMTTQTDKLGFLGGLDIYMINKFLAGYQQGAHYVDPAIDVNYVYSPDPTNPWGDIAGGKVVGQTFFSGGTDIVYAAAGGTGIGVMQAANETDDVYAIGVDSDQDYLAEGKVLCSMLKLVETAVFSSIDDIMQESWTGGATSLGIEENGVGISNMTYTWAEKQEYYTLNGNNKTRGEHIEDMKAMIINGTIVVSDLPVKDVTTTTIISTTTYPTSTYTTTTYPTTTITLTSTTPQTTTTSHPSTINSTTEDSTEVTTTESTDDTTTDNGSSQNTTTQPTIQITFGGSYLILLFVMGIIIVRRKRNR
jgi:basic membrane protein A